MNDPNARKGRRVQANIFRSMRFDWQQALCTSIVLNVAVQPVIGCVKTLDSRYRESGGWWHRLSATVGLDCLRLFFGHDFFAVR